MRACAVVGALLTCVACGTPSHHAPADGPIAADAGVDDGVDDGPADATLDAAPDAPPDAACPTPGPEDIVSGDTPAPTRNVQLAGNGTETMAVWSLGSRSVWAEYDAGGVVASGDIGGWPNTGTLSVLGNRFIANDHNELRVFDGTSWNTFPFRNQMAAASGASLLGLDGWNATIFDGVSVSSPAMITPNITLAAGGDGQGGFAVLTADDNTLGVSVDLSLITYDGLTWGTETLVTAANDGSSYFVDPAVVRIGAQWAVMYAVDGVLTIEIGSGTTWTRKTYATTGSEHFAIAENAGMLAVVGNAGFSAVYRNGGWTSHVLASLPGGALQPRVVPQQSGFVAVYGDPTEMHAAIFDGSAWSSDTVLTTHSASYDVSIAASSDSIAIGFVDDATPPQKKARIFHAGAWGTPLDVDSGGQDHWIAAALGVESDGFRAAYSAPGEAETTVASNGTWSAPEDMPAAATTGAVGERSLARAENRHALVAWIQEVADSYDLFAAEYDGREWGAPVLLQTDATGTPDVMAAGSQFYINWQYTGPDGFPEPRTGRWTGTGADVVTSIGRPKVLFDGGVYIALWSGGTYPQVQLNWSGSHDGISWSFGGTLITGDPRVWSLASGPAGAVAVIEEWNTHAMTYAFWHGGTISIAPPQPTLYHPCASAVGNTDAVVVCSHVSLSSQPIEALVHANNAWSNVVASTSVAQLYPMLATDGTDFRLDYTSGADQAQFSTVLHNGAWSSVVQDLNVYVVRPAVAACGSWFALAGGQRDVVTAQGTTPYAFDHATTPLAGHYWIDSSRDRYSAAWAAPTPTSRDQTVLHVQLGL